MIICDFEIKIQLFRVKKNQTNHIPSTRFSFYPAENSRARPNCINRIKFNFSWKSWNYFKYFFWEKNIFFEIIFQKYLEGMIHSHSVGLKLYENIFFNISYFPTPNMAATNIHSTRKNMATWLLHHT